MKFAVMNTINRFNRPPGYCVLENAKGNWLRRFLIRKMWQWLHRCGALKPYQFTETSYEFGPNEEQHILNAIMRQMNEIVNAGHNWNDWVIVCGAASWSEITKATMDCIATFEICQAVHFDFNGYRGSVRGMKVHVVPRMEGICMIPKVIVEERKR